MQKLSLTIVLFLFVNIIYAQEFHRFSAEYSVKYKEIDGREVLRLGKIFYDINEKKVVMKNGFPIREVLVFNDTTVYQIRNKKVFSKEKIIAPVEFSIFHLALREELKNYGLDKAGYKLDTVKLDKGLIISVWNPPVKYQKVFGNIVISTKSKQLFGIVFLNTNGDVISKHLFRAYTQIKGFSFPTQVVRIKYLDGKEIFETTTYKKIMVNDTGNNEYFSYKLDK